MSTLHAILGGGKVADIMLWKDKKSAGAILFGFTTLWFFLQVREYQFVSLLCDTLMLTMTLGLLWCKFAGRILNRMPREINIQLPESTCIYFIGTINWFLLKLSEITSGKDFKLFFVALAGLYMMSTIGTYISSWNLIYTVILAVGTLPALYARYETQVDTIVARCISGVKRLYELFQVKILDKIPRHRKSN
ncbi:PREDICTED: reticulon-like protein B14 [Fragaria vesca subsp. vesca]|uniref:reticulon-like protein B14 n=1 Tax=Fragaria vesca subsp. vesca TaxID=101020 RepID=UPI0002C30E18|nr:PREDICTED: reticulon-like protein B14 [Fragaria vesca subsp. vesca]